MTHDEDLCPGYAPGVEGPGVCCCGLVFEGALSPHDHQGRAVPPKRFARQVADGLDRWLRVTARRAVRRAEVEAQQRAHYRAWAIEQQRRAR